MMIHLFDTAVAILTMYRSQSPMNAADVTICKFIRSCFIRFNLAVPDDIGLIVIDRH